MLTPVEFEETHTRPNESTCVRYAIPSVPRRMCFPVFLGGFPLALEESD